jgi:hypothetical protein
MLKKVERLILVASLIIIFFGILTLIYLSLSGKFEGWRDVQVREIIVCNRDYTSSNNEDIRCSEVFTDKIEELYVCGEIETKNTIVSNLAILVYKDGVKEPVFVNDAGGQFLNGQFCRKIALPNYNQGGVYQIVIYYFRTIVASTKFEIR